MTATRRRVDISNLIEGKGKALLFLLMLSGCAVKKMPFEPNELLGTDEEYAVYKTLVADTDLYRAKTVVVSDSTRIWNFHPDVKYWTSQMPSLSEETFQNFIWMNQNPVPLNPILCPGIIFVLLSREELNDWEIRYPEAGGAVTVSRVGFNSFGTQALVYWSIYWAPKAAYGSMILLEKSGGQWVIRQNLMIWIS
jgi:hypothetical protein